MSKSLVGFGRRNFLVPVPSLGSFSELNAHLEAACVADMDRSVRGKPEGKARRLEVDRAAMLAIPDEGFDPRRVEHAGANSLSLVRFDRNDYSVPTACAHHEVTVLGGVEDVRIVSGTEVVAIHGVGPKSRSPSIPATTWPSWNASPGPSITPGPWRAGGCRRAFAHLRRRLEADLGSAGTRQDIKVLRLMEKASVHQLARAVEVALSIGATSADAVALILFDREERPVGLFSLDGHPHLKSFVIDPPDLGAYGALTQIGANA